MNSVEKIMLRAADFYLMTGQNKIKIIRCNLKKNGKSTNESYQLVSGVQ